MEIGIQAAILIAGLLALAVLSYLLRRVLSLTVKKEWFYYLLLAPGTIIHELFHVIACLVTLTRIYEFHLFRLRREPDGTVQLGEVVHADVGSVRNFIIAVAPLFGASVLIYFMAVWMLPRGPWTSLLTSGWTYLFLVAVFLIALGLSPSRQDLKALPAFLVMVFVLGLVGYVVVLALPKNWNLSVIGKTLEAALKTANMGLVFVLVVVAVASGVLLVVGEVLRR